MTLQGHRCITLQLTHHLGRVHAAHWSCLQACAQHWCKGQPCVVRIAAGIRWLSACNCEGPFRSQRMQTLLAVQLTSMVGSCRAYNLNTVLTLCLKWFDSWV